MCLKNLLINIFQQTISNGSCYPAGGKNYKSTFDGGHSLGINIVKHLLCQN